jgi:hypothetical protein
MCVVFIFIGLVVLYCILQQQSSQDAPVDWTSLGDTNLRLLTRFEIKVETDENVLYEYAVQYKYK